MSKHSLSQPLELANAPPKDSIHRILLEGRKLITPNLARRVLDEANFVKQRPVVSTHVKLIAHVMREGRWQSGGQIAFCRLNGFLHLTNGQHRMHAVIESGTAHEFQILVSQCATMDEVERDYHRHDVLERKRSIAEIVRSTDISERCGLPRTFLTALYNAGALLAHDLDFVSYNHDPITTRDVDSRLGIVSSWLQEASLYEQMIRSAPSHVRKRMLSAGVMAVALLTIRHQPAKAAQFWRGVAEDDGLRKGDPRKTYLSDLETRNIREGSVLVRVIPPIVAWNAFFDGRELRIIKVVDNAVIALRGTPIDGKRKKRPADED